MQFITSPQLSKVAFFEGSPRWLTVLSGDRSIGRYYFRDKIVWIEREREVSWIRETLKGLQRKETRPLHRFDFILGKRLHQIWGVLQLTGESFHLRQTQGGFPVFRCCLVYLFLCVSFFSLPANICVAGMCTCTYLCGSAHVLRTVPGKSFL